MIFAYGDGLILPADDISACLQERVLKDVLSDNKPSQTCQVVYLVGNNEEKQGQNQVNETSSLGQEEKVAQPNINLLLLWNVLGYPENDNAWLAVMLLASRRKNNLQAINIFSMRSI